MSEQIIGHAIQDIKVGDIIHITVSADGKFLESPEIKFPVPEQPEVLAVEPTSGVVEAELPKAETSEHVETT